MFTRKNLYWLFMMLLVFSCLHSGGGGSGGDDVTIGENNGTTQNQDVTPNVPDNPTIPDNPASPDNPATNPNPTVPNSPTSPDNPTVPQNPTSPDNPAIPDNPTSPDNPAIPDNPTVQDNPSGEFNINGTWRVESGHGHMDVTGRSYGLNLPPEGEPVAVSFDYSYVKDSIPLLNISVTKNIDNEYYTVKLSGDTVKEETWGNNIKAWSVNGAISSDNAPPFARGSFTIGSLNTFTNPETNYYVCDSEDVFNSDPENNADVLDASISFRITDNATIIYSVYQHATQSADSTVSESYREQTATLKRVEQHSQTSHTSHTKSQKAG